MQWAILALILSALPLAAHENVSPQLKIWYAQLMQPDSWPYPKSCCGETDAYYADEVHIVSGLYGEPHLIATITDDRDDEPLGRMHVASGTQYEVPPGKIVGQKQRVGNPIGHGIIFLGTVTRIGHDQELKRDVLCFVANEGL